MTRDETAQVLAVLTAQRWSYERSIDNPAALLAGWQMALEDLALPDVESAVRTWLRTQKRFPAAAELRELVVPTGATTVLASKLYGRYGQLRRRFQLGTLDAAGSAELTHLEHRLGIANLGTRSSQPMRPVPALRAVS